MRVESLNKGPIHLDSVDWFLTILSIANAQRVTVLSDIKQDTNELVLDYLMRNVENLNTGTEQENYYKQPLEINIVDFTGRTLERNTFKNWILQ